MPPRAFGLAMAMVCGLPVAGAQAADWFVDGRHGARYNTGTAKSPFHYLWQALQKVRPGDTIYVVASETYPQLGFTANGTSAAPIVLASADAAIRTKVSGGGINSGIWVDGNYLVVRDFDVTAPGPYPAVSIAPNHHHITIASNVIHDAGANGVNTIADDYITVSHNAVYGNAKNTSRAFGSGVSFLGSVDIDRSTGVKMIIDGNIIYGNTNVPDCTTTACWRGAQDSDGSGIILDDNLRERFDHIPYRGRFLVSNNVIYKNGGRGVHVYKTDNATITGNTLWSNNQDRYESFWHPGEVSGLIAGNVAVYDNILFSDGRDSPIHTGTAPNSHVSVSFEQCRDQAGPLVVRYNLGYDPQNDAQLFSYAQDNTAPLSIEANIFAGPKLDDPNQGIFQTASGSPAYKAANAATSVAVDILGISRQPKPSIGAYQQLSP